MKRLILLALLCCAGVTAVAGEPPPMTPERATELGNRAADLLMARLKGELSSALRRDGPVGAIEVCSKRAQPLTAQVAADLGVPGLELRRTSLRVRNRLNRPDGLEAEVLAAWEKTLREGGRISPRLVEAKGVYRYFRPIRTGPLCLTCHGPEETFPAELRDALEDRYPGDWAVGFRSGDLRGMFSVTLPR